MMTERSMNTQPLMERDALSPSEPATDEIVILGYDSHPTQTEAIRTVHPEDPHQKRVEEGVNSNLHELDHWLQFKVKNALVAQIFTGLNTSDGAEKEYINITDVSRILREELESEQTKHFQAARELQYVSIPQAEMRTGPELNSKNPYIYWKDDVDNLYDRVEVHNKLAEVIEELGVEDSDSFRTFTEVYIQRTYDQARNEVISILKDQKKELETRKQQDVERIEELEHSLDQLISQNLETLDSEIVEHLTEQAKEIAR